eukprot:10771988-Ditylum_brightwellii.AAC.1
MNNDILDQLRITADMMKDTHFDTKLLGVENLFFLTTEGSTTSPMSLYVAGAVLKGGNCDSEYIKTSIEHLILYNQNLEDCHESWLGGFDEHYKEEMRYYALAVLANSLQ